MMMTIRYSNGQQQDCVPDASGRLQWKAAPGPGSIMLCLDNACPCLLTNLTVTAGEAGACICTPENGTLCAPGLLVMEKAAVIRVLVPENCTGHPLAGQAWITELPEGHPLPERLIQISREASERDSAARKEIEALRAADQTLVGSVTFPGTEEPDKGSSEFMHLQDLYFKTIRSTSWRITAPLRTVKGKIKLMKGLKK